MVDPGREGAYPKITKYPMPETQTAVLSCSVGALESITRAHRHRYSVVGSSVLEMTYKRVACPLVKQVLAALSGGAGQSQV